MVYRTYVDATPERSATHFALADRILMPAFSTLNVHNMFDDMVDVIGQLCDKWARYVLWRSLF